LEGQLDRTNAVCLGFVKIAHGLREIEELDGLGQNWNEADLHAVHSNLQYQSFFVEDGRYYDGVSASVIARPGFDQLCGGIERPNEVFGELIENLAR
jgi:hypothetical protein